MSSTWGPSFSENSRSLLPRLFEVPGASDPRLSRSHCRQELLVEEPDKGGVALRDGMLSTLQEIGDAKL